MDWFNNIGCEELENEAVAYFEQYKGSIPEVLASSSNELNVSDNGDSDIEDDESDIENICHACDTIQARTRKYYSTSKKLVTTQKLIDHIQSARMEREYYKLCTNRSRDELKLAEYPIGKYNTTCSTNFKNVHYTFDFLQYVNLPHSSKQDEALYFLIPRGKGKFHHFRFTSDEVGVVFTRETLDKPEKRLVLLKESANLSELLTKLPVVIPPGGLTEERRRYLYNIHDKFCPRSSEE
ncbi:unnamed protein product [Mytilus coruscus]|uniref:Uncharacterized protein n=1 Tax=Mytilus coruscus TaxID=42192 RepID=A0A6J8E8T3_MYTCO|nr:unnamed protein product [Mytilus coruscus]